MPRIYRRGHRERAILTDAMKEELWFGTHILDAWPEELFASEDDRRGAWLAHGAALTEEFIERWPLGRPWAWWKYDRQRDKPKDRDTEADTLLEMGVLTENELRRLALELPEPCHAMHVPDLGPIARSLKKRRAWHESEGRVEMAARFARKLAEVENELRRRTTPEGQHETTTEKVN